MGKMNLPCDMLETMERIKSALELADMLPEPPSNAPGM